MSEDVLKGGGREKVVHRETHLAQPPGEEAKKLTLIENLPRTLVCRHLQLTLEQL